MSGSIRSGNPKVADTADQIFGIAAYLSLSETEMYDRQKERRVKARREICGHCTLKIELYCNSRDSVLFFQQELRQALRSEPQV